MRYVRPEDGERLPGDTGGLGITRPEWHAFLDDLLELNRAGALGGIRAIVDERLRQVRKERRALPGTSPGIVVKARDYLGQGSPSSWPITAAMLAAAIDLHDATGT